MKEALKLIAGMLCLLLFFSCDPSREDKRKKIADIAVKQLDSLSVQVNKLITTGSFEKGIVLARKGITDATIEKNDSMLSRFYWMASLYFQYKPLPQKDSQQYYTLLAEKHALLSGNKKLQLYTLSKLLPRYYASNQPDSAIAVGDRSFQLAHELKDSVVLLELNQMLSQSYRDIGSSEQEYQYLSQAMDIYRRIKYKYPLEDTAKESKKVRLIYISVLYSLAGYFNNQDNFRKSLEYYNELDNLIPEKRKSHNPLIPIGKGSCYEKLGEKDSAYKYFKQAVQKTDTSWYFNELRSVATRNYGRLLLIDGRFIEAEKYLGESLRLAHEIKVPDILAESRLAYVDFLMGKKLWSAVKDSLEITRQELEVTNHKALKARVYETLYKVSRETGDFQQALHYYTISEAYQDSLNMERSIRTIAEIDTKYQTDKKNQQITLLKKNNRIQELQLLAARRLRLFYILGVAVLIALFGIFYYYRRAHQQRRLERMRNELETKALRAQMKPHFIFNCLNAIQELIVTQDYSRSSQYLAEFSRLLRMVLQLADKNFNTLQQEVELCGLYISLESLRLKNGFHYNITVDEKMDAEVILFPTLLVQPFIENAIWHGLSNKKGEKHLSVSFEEIGDRIRCTICDNGVGRARSAEIKAAKIGAEHFDSKGIKIAEQRVFMLREGLVKDASITIEDLYDTEGKAAGTKVVIEIILL